jgi:hypothetical protein
MQAAQLDREIRRSAFLLSTIGGGSVAARSVTSLSRQSAAPAGMLH